MRHQLQSTASDTRNCCKTEVILTFDDAVFDVRISADAYWYGPADDRVLVYLQPTAVSMVAGSDDLLSWRNVSAIESSRIRSMIYADIRKGVHLPEIDSQIDDDAESLAERADETFRSLRV